MKIITRLCILLVLTAGTVLQASESFNTLVYHHVSEETPASTSVSPEKFREHLQYLKDNEFNVISLAEALEAVRSASELPEKAVVITFDDGFRDIYSEALPLLREFNYPFTVFVSTDAIDQKLKGMLSWDQIREMHNAGVSFANHTRDHGYLVRHRQYDSFWQQSMRENILHAQSRLEQELSTTLPKWLAYPYGEFNLPLQELINEMGYTGFGQHSGGIWAGSNFQALPRFAAAGIYANTKTLGVKLNSRPMPVVESDLADMVTYDQQPALTANLTDISDLSTVLNCFVDGRPEPAVWTAENQFEVQSSTELNKGRHRFNCTSRSKSGNFYYWFSKPWLVLKSEGK